MLMHETMVAKGLFESISAETAKQNANPICARISCGQLYALNEEILRFAFKAVAKGTPCQNVRIDVEQKPLQARCKSCDETFDLDIQSIICPNCNRQDVEILPDAPIVLEEIEFEEN